MDPRVAPLAEILRLNTRLFRNCLDGLTDEQAGTRLSTRTNNAAFVAAHVADARFFLLTVIGAETTNPLAPYLAFGTSIENLRHLPMLAEVRDAWTLAGHKLRDRLESISSVELDAPAGFPTALASTISGLAFLVQHESYHVGQLALLRKHVGLPAMSYS
jgi:uncharacterized damage-inducible protein DinB